MKRLRKEQPFNPRHALTVIPVVHSKPKLNVNSTKRGHDGAKQHEGMLKPALTLQARPASVAVTRVLRSCLLPLTQRPPTPVRVCPNQGHSARSGNSTRSGGLIKGEGQPCMQAHLTAACESQAQLQHGLHSQPLRHVMFPTPCLLHCWLSPRSACTARGRRMHTKAQIQS